MKKRRLARPIMKVAACLTLGALLITWLPWADLSKALDSSGSHKFDWRSPSQITCTGSTWYDRVCIIENVLFWEGTLYTIPTDDLDLPLPQVRVNGWTTLDSYEYHRPEPNHFFKSLNTSDVAAALSLAGLKNSDLEYYDAAMLTTLRQKDNYWHGMDEARNLQRRFCRDLNICAYSHQRSLRTALLMYDWFPGPPPSSTQDMLSCLGDIVFLRRQSYSLCAEHTKCDKAAYFKRVAIGAGAERMHPFDWGPGLQVQLVPPSVNVKATQYFRECAGLSAAPLSRAHPGILFVNREFQAGRSIVALDEVVQHLKQLPNVTSSAVQHSIENAKLVYLAGRTFKEQAQLFNVPNVVVLPHGAAAANLYFLPANAVVFEVTFDNVQYDGWIPGHIESFPRDIYNVSMLSMRPPLMPLVHKLESDPKFQNLTASEKLTVVMSTTPFQDPETERLMPGVAKYHFNYHVNVTDMAQAVLDAIHVWQAKE